MEGFNLDSLLAIGRDANGSVEYVHDLGIFTVGTNGVQRVDNPDKGTHSIIFPLEHGGTTVMKFAKLRNNASLDASQYHIKVGKLTADLFDKNGNFYKNDKGEEVGQKGSLDFYAESLGGTPRPARVADTTVPLDSTAKPFGG